METSSPLMIANSVVQSVLGLRIPVDEDSASFEFYFNDKQKATPPFEARVIWSRYQSKVLLGMAIHFDLAPLRNPEKLAQGLGCSVGPFLNYSNRDVVSRLVFHKHEGAVIPACESIVDYEALDDSELWQIFQAGFVNSVHALYILAPVFYSLEHGYKPTREQCRQLLEHADREWRQAKLEIETL